MTGRGHCLHLYLADEIELGLIEVQSKHKLGRTFAGQLVVIEGLYQSGALAAETYAFFKDRYSTPLLDRPKEELKAVRKATPPQTLKQIRERTEIEELEKQFGNALDQWSTMKESSKEYYLRKAGNVLQKYPDLNNAKLLLDLANPNYGETTL